MENKRMLIAANVDKLFYDIVRKYCKDNDITIAWLVKHLLKEKIGKLNEKY